ncbi:peptidylprolyl isomerase [Lentibacillus cibarius]|uniref:Foldase protein PrsA n=1 Tax=Lentibacillus cibarius TaxID=2583219 RepID=A0A5S3QM42_9BACI|nr:peptidylprolyl isomerase [Lentibacillus cibarius]TMN23024.1 foldase [Lentibacillus cibarius]
MKKIAIAVTLTASVFTLAACNSGDDSKIVAETDAGNVTKDEFYQELKERYGEDVLREMVTVEVLDDKYDVSEKQIDKEVQNVKDQLGNQFQTALKRQGFKDEQAFRKMLKLSLLQEEAVAEDMDISEKEMKEKYERMKTEVQAQHILVQDEKTAKEVKKKLDNGGDFAKLAKEYSEDTKTKDEGGKLGYFSTGKMTPAFEDKAYSMETGKISEPVKTDYGYHIIKVTDKRETEKDIGSFKDNKDGIRRDIINQRMDVQKAREKVNGLLDDANIDVKVKDLKGIFAQKASNQKDKEEDK